MDPNSLQRVTLSFMCLLLHRLYTFKSTNIEGKYANRCSCMQTITVCIFIKQKCTYTHTNTVFDVSVMKRMSGTTLFLIHAPLLPWLQRVCAFTVHLFVCKSLSQGTWIHSMIQLCDPNVKDSTFVSLAAPPVPPLSCLHPFPPLFHYSNLSFTMCHSVSWWQSVDSVILLVCFCSCWEKLCILSCTVWAQPSRQCKTLITSCCCSQTLDVVSYLLNTKQLN